MKRIFIVSMFMIMCASVVSATKIALEFQGKNGKFENIIASAFYVNNRIEMITFHFDQEKEFFTPNVYIYQIIGKEKIGNSKYNIKCKNQLGVIMNGILDLSSSFKPVLELIADDGSKIVNMSDRGKKI